jgi:hypothetical protein
MACHVGYVLVLDTWTLSASGGSRGGYFSVVELGLKACDGQKPKTNGVDEATEVSAFGPKLMYLEHLQQAL